MDTAVAFTYNDANTSTRRSHDVRKYGIASIKQDPDGGVYIVGDLGCSKTRPTVHEALIEYLGGRELLSHSVY